MSDIKVFKEIFDRARVNYTVDQFMDEDGGQYLYIFIGSNLVLEFEPETGNLAKAYDEF